MIPRVDSAPHGVETPTPLVGCCLMEPVRQERCSFSQRRGPTAPGDDTASYADKKIVHISATSITREQRREFPASIPPRRVWKPHPHWWVAVSWRLSPGRVIPLANVSVLPNPERARSHPRTRNSSISLRPQQPGSRDRDPPGLNRPAGYGNSNPAHWLLSHIEIPRTECCPPGQLQSPAAPGEDRVSSPDKESF